MVGVTGQVRDGGSDRGKQELAGTTGRGRDSRSNGRQARDLKELFFCCVGVATSGVWLQARPMLNSSQLSCWVGSGGRQYMFSGSGHQHQLLEPKPVNGDLCGELESKMTAIGV